MSTRKTRAPSLTQRIFTTITSWSSSSSSPSLSAPSAAAKKPSPPTSASATVTYSNLHIPAEIVDIIILYVKLAHNCRTCYVRDLASLSLVNRSFHAAVEDSLYTSVQIHDGLSRRSWNPNRTITTQQPMALFLRTVTTSPDLASLVRFLDLSVDPDEGAAETYALIAKIITACPRLESFKGDTAYFPQPMNGNVAAAVGKALYSKTSLREHSWWAPVYQAGYQYFGFNLDTFISYHDSWEQLETFVLRGWRSDQRLNRPLKHDHVIKIWEKLSMRSMAELQAAGAEYHGMDDFEVDSEVKSRKSRKKRPLRRLYITKFTLEEINDGTLKSAAFAFPELQSLRLERLTPLSAQGIIDWAAVTSSDAARSLSTDPSSRLESLTIVECWWAKFGAAELRTLLLSLPHLRRFTFRPWKDTFKLAELSEEQKKLILEEESKGYPSMEYQPILESEKLENLFWQVQPAMPANYWLYYSIVSGGLPNLRTLTAPFDENGILQGLCEEVINPAQEELERLKKMVPRQLPGAVVRKAWKRAADELINPSDPPPLPPNLQTEVNFPQNSEINPGMIAAARRRKLRSRITFDLRSQHPYCHTFLLLDRDLCWVKSGQTHDPSNMYDEDDELDHNSLDRAPDDYVDPEEEITRQRALFAAAGIDDPLTSQQAAQLVLAQDLAARQRGALPPNLPHFSQLSTEEQNAVLASLPQPAAVALTQQQAPPPAAAATAEDYNVNIAGNVVNVLPAHNILNQAPPARRLAPHEYEGEDYTCEYGSNAEYGDERDLRRQQAVVRECEVGGTWCCGKWNSPKGNSGGDGGSISPVITRTGSLIARTASMKWKGGVAGRRASGAGVKERNWWHVPRPTEDLGRGREIGLKDFF